MWKLIQPVVSFLDNIFAYPLFYLGPVAVSINGIFKGLFFLLLIIAFGRILRNILNQYLLNRLGIDEGNREALSTIISYVVGALSFITLLQATGFNFASLAVVAGALGVGIGFGLQNFSRDFISGLTLLIERSIKVGDFIELGNEDSYQAIQGTVKTIALRSATIQTKDGANLIIPNNRLVESPVVNWGAEGSPSRLVVPVRVGRENDVVSVTEVLLNVAYSLGDVLLSPSPKVCFMGVEEDFYSFELHLWIVDMKHHEYIRSRAYFTMEQQFRHYDIQFQPSYQDMIVAFESPEFIDPIATYRNRIWSKRQQVSQLLHERMPHRLFVRDLLVKIKYFEDLNDLEILQLISVGYRRRLRPQEILFHESDPGDAFYLLLQGKVEVKVVQLDQSLSILHPGDFFGELSLLLGIPRSATVIALEDTLLFAVNKQGFQQLLRQHSELYEVIISGLSKYQEELKSRQETLRQMGLIDSLEDDKNPVDWARKRLKKLFLP